MELPARADIVIIGGGIIGASTAYHLARAGARSVVLLERNPLFGMESTYKCAGGVRAHFDTEVNVNLSCLSLRAFGRFEEDTGYSVDYRKCGYLFVLIREGDVEAFQRQMEMTSRLGVPTEWWSGDDVRARLPMMAWADALGALWGPEDGLADNGAAVQGYVSAAGRLGARCLTDVAVTGIRSVGGRVEAVETPKGTILAGAVVNAAGAWAAEVGRMAGLDVPIVPSRRQILVTAAMPEIPSDFPMVVDFARALYFHREGQGLLTGMSNPTQAPGFDQTVDEEWELVHLEAAAERLPALERTGIARRWAGLYEITPDHHPILGPVEGVDGFFMNAGFSGHGFMHGPAAGLLLAEEILDGKAHSLDIGALRLERFRRGALLSEYNVI